MAKLARFTEAEALLVESANPLQGNDTMLEHRKTEASQRVVDLYAAWHAAEPDDEGDHGPWPHATKAAHWRAKLAE